jgi:DNA-binding transcriptional MocR family regulator
VVYVGTFSKTLYPGLRLGYVVPSTAGGRTQKRPFIAAAIRLSSWRWRSLSTPVITRPHIRRMRLLYSRRRVF